MSILLNGDCLEELKDLDDKSINLVLTDPPYNINHKNLEWDNIKNYNDFMLNVFLEAHRVLKKNGSLYFFHNNFETICDLQNILKNKTNFKFQRFITLTKDSYITKLYPNCKSWINCCEYILIYIKDEIREEKQIEYFSYLHKKIGKSKSQIKKDIPLADHCFRVSKNNFALPTEETYNKIIELYDLKDLKDLKELRTYIDLNYIYNGKSKANYLHTKFKKLTNHPCEKPYDLLKLLVETASNEGDVVLDMFMGTCNLGLVCKETNRNFIGIEKDKEYFDIAVKRINNHKKNIII
tara:strand:- start:7 stop:891 length:885 start_codon:yes stop_codon:yes gene_type:complete